jgi:hypothetical protein
VIVAMLVVVLGLGRRRGVVIGGRGLGLIVVVVVVLGRHADHRSGSGTAAALRG